MRTNARGTTHGTSNAHGRRHSDHGGHDDPTVITPAAPRRGIAAAAGALLAAAGIAIAAPAAGAAPAAEDPVPAEQPAAEQPAEQPTEADGGAEAQGVDPVNDTGDRWTAPPGWYGHGLNTYEHCIANVATAVFTGSENTSCPFANLVGDRFAGEEPSAGEVQWQRVESPVTGRTYDMRCRQARDADLDWLWKCEGGANAVVYVYP
ncbi:hypothetical protein [Corynebacterium sp. 335C]